MPYTKHFKKIFIIRFVGYFFIMMGLIVLTLVIEPVINEEARYQFNQLIGRQFTLPTVVTSAGSDQIGAGEGAFSQADSSNTLGSLLSGQSEIIVPVSTDFGIVIEKINANAKVVADVDSGNEKAYSKALAEGVAHAKGTSYPGQKGNVYLFSHSTDAPWNLVRFNAIFYLLGKLEAGDRIVMFYQGKRYDYIVFDKTVVPPTETEFLTNVYDQSVLTLQTCDPPGTLLNRLIVRAKLAGS